MPKRTAHDLEEKWRSDDIRSGEDVDFSSLLLPDEILQGLTAAGFKYPSPIQLKAIPATRIGKDVIVQAKSGTGKTLVFAVAALNVLMKGSKHPQVLIMAPTREIACQISQVINAISAARKDIKCQFFIGGYNPEDDVRRIEGCQIIVGTPGRIRYLITAKILRTSGIRLFVFDEADQLLREKSFDKDINDIFRSLPRDKQIIATSATYHRLKKLIDKYFREPIIIRLNQQNIALLGMAHYYREIPVINLPVLAYKLKLKSLKDVLHSVKFAQCLVFCNMVSRVENLCVDIKKLGFATSFISSAREQEDRLKAIEMLRRFKCKVLVTSDVSSRGIDAENVDLVINFDLPPHLDIYFHRVGRAGRYGARCANVSFVTSSEIDLYLQMRTEGNFKSFLLSFADPIPSDLISRGQPETSDDESNSPTSDLDSDAEDVNKNGEAQPEKTNNFIDCIQLNGDEVESKSNSDSDSDAENLNKNEKAQQKKTKVFNLNSNPTNTSCTLSNTSQFVEQELYKSDPPVFHKIKPGKKITEVIVALEEENNKLKVNGSSIEELSVNDEIVGEKLDQQSCASSVIENTKNGFSPHIHELKQSTDTNSYLAHLESGSEKSLEEKTNNDNLLVMNNKGSTSKNFSNPVSKELIRSVITFIEKYEKQKDFAGCSSSNFTKSSQTIEVELEDNKFSPASLASLSSNLGQYYYNIYKEFIVNIPEVWIKEIALEYKEVKNDDQVLEIGNQNDLKQIHGENKVPDSNLNLQHPLFSTPKRGAPLGSGEESSNCDENELTEQFNLYLKNRRSKEVKRMSSAADIRINRKLMTMLENERQLGCNNETVDKSNEKDIINDARSDSDASIEILYDSRKRRIKEKIIDVKSDSELDASVQCLYASKQRIKEDMEGYDDKCRLNSQSDSDTMDVLSEASSRDSAEDESFNKFVDTVLAYKKGKHTDAGPSKDAKNLSKLPPEIQCNDRRIKCITKVDTRKHAESPSSTSSNSRKGTVKPQKGVDRIMQNEKNKVANAKKSPNYTICKKKTVKGSAQNKITYYYSETENDVDQLPTEAQSSLQDEHQRKTHGNDERVSKTDDGCGTELMNRPGQKKIAINNSESISSEAEVSCDQYSKVCDFNPQGRRHNRKRTPKKDKTLPETGPSGFGYSKDTLNPSCSRQSQNHGNQTAHHFDHPMQPSYDASSLYNDQYSHQSPIMNEQVHHSRSKKQSSTDGPNPYYQKYPQKDSDHKCSADFSTNNFNRPKNLCPYIRNAPSIREVQPSHDNFNPCFMESRHPCHPPNESCQSVLCATWYDIFYKQWQFRNPTGY